MNNFNQTKIEETVGALLRGVVSANVFYNRPASSTKDLSDFVVVKILGAIQDLGTFGEFTLSIQLFAKNASNMKLSKKLGLMQTSLLQTLPAATGDLLIDDNPMISADADDGYGYHFRIINFSTIIKITS